MKIRVGAAGTGSWAMVLALLALGGYYYTRTVRNARQLEDRNLRELSRIARTVEARVNNFEKILGSLKLEESAELKKFVQDPLVPDLSMDYCWWGGSGYPCVPDTLPSGRAGNSNRDTAEKSTFLYLDRARGLRFYHWRIPESGSERRVRDGVEVTWGFSELKKVVRTDFFDEVFLADEGGDIFLVSGQESTLRMRQVPAAGVAQGAQDDEYRSAIREFSVGAAEHVLFTQPVQIRISRSGERPERSEIAKALDELEPTRWIVGGVVSKARFHAESLALEPAHRVFLGLLLIFSILALPFVHVRFMGDRERLEVGHVLRLGISFVLGAGVFGACLANLSFYSNLREEVDTQLSRLGRALDSKVATEIEVAIRELRHQTAKLASELSVKSEQSPWFREDLFRESANEAKNELPCEGREGRIAYPYFQMVFWAEPDGQQRGKWTPKPRNTPAIKIASRAYFKRVREGTAWTKQVCGRRQEYFLESIQSLTTGEQLAALSIPICWSGGENGGGLSSGGVTMIEGAESCERDRRGIAAMILRPFSLDGPVLPPGFEFAVIDREGLTLFHSHQERNLQENLFEETGNDPRLASLVAARADGFVSLDYMGRGSRLYVRPIADTALALVVIMQRGYLGTVNLEALFVGGSLFVIYVLVLLTFFVLTEAAMRRRLVWAWPDARHRSKHRLLALVFLLFAFELLLHALSRDLFPLHLSSLLVPFQALGLGLVVLTRPLAARRLRRLADCSRGARWSWPNTRLRVRVCREEGCCLGWLWVGTATGIMVAMNLVIEPPGGLLLLVQLAVTVLAVGLVRAKTGESTSEGEQDERSPGRFYGCTILLALIVTGGLPGYLLYGSVFFNHLELLGRHSQVAVVERLEGRDQRLVERELRISQPQSRLARRLGAAFMPFLSSTAESGSELGGNVDSPPQSDLHHRVHGLVAPWVPLATEVAVEMRHLFEGPEEVEWSTTGSVLRLRGSPYQVESLLPNGLGRPTFPWFLCLIFGLWLFGKLSSWLGLRVFLAGLSHAAPISLQDDEGRRCLDDLAGPGPCLLVVCTRSMDRDPLRLLAGVHYVNMIDLAPPLRERDLAPPSARGKSIVIDYFDYRFDNRPWNQSLLALIERLVYVQKARLVLLTSREPVDPIAISPGGEGDGALAEKLRWKRVLGRFVLVHVKQIAGGKSAEGEGESERENRDRDLDARIEAYKAERLSSSGSPIDGTAVHRFELLKSECEPLEQLEQCGLQILKREDFEKLSQDGLIDQIREAAAGHYRAVWTILLPTERLVVAQLAAGSVVNPKSEGAIRHLLARGLLVRDPELRLMNESFGRFVRETVPVDEIRAWEGECAVSAWQQLRFPLYLGLATVALFMLVTQQELFSVGAAFVSSIAVGAGALLNLANVLRRAPLHPGGDGR